LLLDVEDVDDEEVEAPLSEPEEPDAPPEPDELVEEPEEELPELELSELDFELESPDVEDEGPLTLALDARESLMYQPLPLKTIPTGWMILRKLPPHCSHVVSGGSEKLWRFSMTSLQVVQVYV